MFGLKKLSEENIVKSIRKLFKLNNEDETNNDRIIKNIRTLSEQEEKKLL